MKLNIDFFFTYRYTLRFLLLNKLGNIVNIYEIPKIKKIIFLFSLKKLEELDDVQIYNSFYFFKFFLGRNAFFSKTKSSFSLGKWHYNLNIQLILNDQKGIYSLFFYFLNNVFFIIEKSFLKKGFFSKKLNIFYYIIKDMNFFSEIKNNLGLFNLKSALILNIYILGADFKKSNLFLKNLKVSS